MSASRWSICPQCYKRASIAETEFTKQSKVIFETGTAKEYAAFQDKRPEPTVQSVIHNATLREDWSFGIDIDSGEFEGGYWASCEVCGFEYSCNMASQRFIDHIQKHLEPGQEVICKICGKTAKEIIENGS